MKLYHPLFLCGQVPNIDVAVDLAHKNVSKEFLLFVLFHHNAILSVRNKELSLMVFQVSIED